MRYEVRKALTAGVPFRPKEIRSYYFVIEAPRPPMIAAVNKPGQKLTVRTTAYCHDEDDHLAYGARNALGTPLKFGKIRSAAADWSRYPVGTRFRIHGQPDVTYVVDDYGSALVGTGTIDIYKPTRGMMNAWGVRHVDIEVLEWGSWQKSMEIMRERTRWPHVRAMMRGIEERIYQAQNGSSTWRNPLTAAL
ncbi:MAG: 3D domain-containing protein [Prosthecobacter sp.]|nr:3D domain-containing protein [Prosthecobacter sp.]